MCTLLGGDRHERSRRDHRDGNHTTDRYRIGGGPGTCVLGFTLAIVTIAIAIVTAAINNAIDDTVDSDRG